MTTCMGRLEHLRQSLPRLASHSGLACLVVDYGCPQACGDWVEQNHPQVQVVRADAVRHFSVSRARNLGARAATTPWICFMDADTLVGPTFAADLRAACSDNSFLLLSPWQEQLTGLVACRLDSFNRIGGYDELFEGWGSEDLDLYWRLRRSGCQQAPLSLPGTSAIAHPDALRTQHHAITNRALAQRINMLYFQVKTDLARLTDAVEIPLADRQAVRAKVQEILLASPNRNTVFDVTLPWTTDSPHPAGWQLRRTMQFLFEPNATISTS